MRWLGLLLLLVACDHAARPSSREPDDEIVQNRTEAPSIPARCTAAPPECLPEAGLIDVTGHDLAPSLAGKVVILEYWATWCMPCQAEIPVLDGAGEDVAIIGIVTEQLAPDELAQARRDLDVRYPVVPITPALAELVDVPTNLPTGYVFDKHGYRRDTHVGLWDAAELTETIERLRAEP